MKSANDLGKKGLTNDETTKDPIQFPWPYSSDSDTASNRNLHLKYHGLIDSSPNSPSASGASSIISEDIPHLAEHSTGDGGATGSLKKYRFFSIY